jgi:hypothetical protein
LAGRWTRLDLRRCPRATPGRRGQPHFQSVDAAGSWLPRPKSQAEMPRWIALLAPGDCSPRRRCSAGPASQDAVEPLGVVRGQAGPADRGQDPIWQQRGAAQRVGDAGHVGGRRRHVPAWVGRGSAVAGPVVRHPAHAALGGSWEQGLRRRAKVWRAVVSEHRQAALGTIGQGVVRVQCAPVAQQQIGLFHHPPSIPRARAGVEPPAPASKGGDCSPCWVIGDLSSP